MRNYLSLALVFLFLWTSVYGATKTTTTKVKDPVIITSASCRSSSLVIPQGSLAGGTTLYLKASGLSTTVAKNAVFVGSYSCVVPENGVSGQSIICVTSAVNSGDTQIGSLPIVIKVSGSADSTCTAGNYCYFTYLQSQTSTLDYLTPRVNYIGQWSYWRGQFLVSSPSSITMTFGNQICDTSQSSQSSISSSDDVVQCKVPTDGVAGVYTVSATTVNGNQQNSLSLSQQYATSESTYEAVLLPVITGLSTNVLSNKGGVLYIYGLGFGYGTCQVRVYVGGQIQSKNAAVIGNDGSTITVRFFNITINGQEFYVDGSGLRYLRWWGSTVYSNTTIGEPDVQNVYGSYFNEQFLGLFKAPKTGQYRFYIASDDTASIELNTNPWSIDTTHLQVVANNTQYTQYRNYWQYLYATPSIKSVSDYIDLEEGQYYQIRINHTNGAGTGYLTVAVEIENDVWTDYSLGAVYQLQTSYTPIQEVVQYSVYNKLADTLLQGNYQLVFSSTLSPAFSYTSVSLSSTATAAQVESAVNALGYSVSVQSFKVDSSGSDLTDQSLTTGYAGFRYEITFLQYRSVQVLPNFVFNITTNANAAVGKAAQQTVTPATPIEGTFQLAYDDENGVEHYLYIGQSTDLPFNATADQISSAIQSSTGYKPLVWTTGTANDGYTWYVQIKGVQELPNLRVIENNLLSGNGQVDFTITTLSESSSNTFYEPIPNELLFTYSKTPTVSITLNGLLSTCTNQVACNLAAPVNLQITTTDFTYDGGDTLTMIVSVGTSTKQIDPDLVTISMGDFDCTDISYDDSNYPEYEFQCTLVDNEFVYGEYIPVLHYEGYGNADVDSAVLPYQAPLVITSIGPTSGSEDGGTVVTLTTKGFPNDVTDLNIQLGGVDAIIVSASYDQVVIKTPTYVDTMTDSVITGTYSDGTASNSDFTYDHEIHITITSVQETILTPIYKGFNTIIGSGFGTITNDITVQLINDKKTYECPVVSVTDTEIVVYLRGGLPGVYTFSVNRANVGEATAVVDANKFQYNTVVTSVEPATGSSAGGQYIKIVGFNFVPQETIVFIGNQINWICDLDEAASTSTELYCTTPASHPSYTSPQDIIVTTRILFESICQGNCQYNYDASQTLSCSAPSDVTSSSGSRFLSEEQKQLPDYQKFIKVPQQQVTQKKGGVEHLEHHQQNPRRDMTFWNDYVLDKIKQYSVDQTETISCSTTTSQTVQVTFNDAYTVTGTIDSTGQLQYTVPDLPQGEYKTKIVSTNGFATSMWITNVELNITSISTTTVTQGGTDIEIDGTGFGDDNNIEVYVGTLKCLKLKKVGNRKLKCRTPRITTNGAYAVKVLYDDVRKNSQIKSSCSSQNNITVTNVGQPAITSITNNAAIVYQSDKSAYTFTKTDNVTFTIVGSNLNANTLTVHLEKDDVDDIFGTIIASNSTSITVQFTNVSLGLFSIVVNGDGKVALWNTWQYQNIYFQNPSLSGSLSAASLKGGKELEINGNGFNKNHKVRVCGKQCEITSVGYDKIKCKVPDFNPGWAKKQHPAMKQKHYKLDHDDFTVTSDVTDKSVLKKFYDGLETTYHSSNAASNCWVQVDWGKNRTMKLEHLSFLPRLDATATYLKGVKFQYSTDGTTFKDWFTVDDDVHKGWNVKRPEKQEKSKEKNEKGGEDDDHEPECYNHNSDFDKVRAIKFIDTKGTSGSRCQIADIDFRGWLENDSTDTTQTSCDVEIVVDDTVMGTISSSVTYDQSSTPIIESVSPKDVSPTQQTLITITGTGFVSGSTTVTIDEIDCAIQSVTSTQITCLSGLKDVTTASVTGQFVVTVNGDQAIVNDQVIYGQRWSNIQTWGGYVFPADGDSVMVYEGATLIVDVHTPKLVQVLVEGNLVFADDVDTSLDAQYLVINRGTLQIGTQESPQQHKVDITIRGEETGVQYPNMGNKMIGCSQCVIGIHGYPRTPSWTLLSSTTTNSNTITVDDAVNWLIGDEIVITSSVLDQFQTEVRTITAISADQKTLTLNSSLSNTHESVFSSYNGITFNKQVEVGVLTRSITIKGDQQNNHGVHIYVQGTQDDGTEVRIENVEIINGGQQRFVNRFPINFNNNGVLTNSYIRSNSIHDSNARCIGLQSVQYLEVSDNICYNIIGHAIYLQNGDEAHNSLVHNLVTVVRSTWQLYQNDATAAAFWISNPQNIVTDNRVGGAQWYGFYLAFKSTPTGAASAFDICPTGQPMLNFTNNAVHSTGYIGLRIGTLIPRTTPCASTRNDALDNPFTYNPSVQTVISGFTTWANQQIGVLTENLGNVLLKDFLIADSYSVGYQQNKANYSQEGTTINNFVIVGTSTTIGLVVPRTNGFLADQVVFANFPSTSTLIKSCAQCESYLVWVTGGKNTHFRGIKIVNSANAKIIKWNNFKREIFWDLDGSLTGITAGAQIVAYKLHLDGLNGCTYHNNTQWDQSIVCDSSQTALRDMIFNYPTPYDQHVNQPLRIYRVPSINAPLPQDITQYQYEQYVGIWSGDIAYSYASQFALGYTYNINLLNNWLSMAFMASDYLTASDLGLVFRFNYTVQRETFDVFRNKNNKFISNYTQVSSIPDPKNCNNGDWYNDKTTAFFYICISGKQRVYQESVAAYGIYCRETCPAYTDSATKTKVNWSDLSIWVNNTLPIAGSNVTIQSQYIVIIDVELPEFDTILILGELWFSQGMAVTTLKARQIFVRNGKLVAGSATQTFTSIVNIVLTGSQFDESLLIDNNIDAGNNVLAVTGGLELYGKIPGTTVATLTADAVAGSSYIIVSATTDWQVGDWIAISPTGASPDEAEQVQITSISGSTVSFAQTLKYNHQGVSNSTRVDTRAQVLHLTRNIKITSNTEWGCRVLVYAFTDTILRRGYVQLHGVELSNCGQVNTEFAGLDIQYAVGGDPAPDSDIIGSSFHNSYGYLLQVVQSENINIQRNIFFNGQKALVQVVNSNYIKFQYNTLVLVQKRVISVNSAITGTYNWAVLGSFRYSTGSKITKNIILVTNNVGIGSTDTGFHIMTTACSEASNAGFAQNYCYNAVQACFSLIQASSTCNVVSSMYAYNSGVGIMASIYSQNTTISNFQIIESDRGLVIKPGSSNVYSNVVYVSNGYISAVELGVRCSSQIAFQLVTVSANAYPGTTRSSSNADIVDHIERMDTRVYINNVQFDNYKLTYDAFPQCSNNAVFRQNVYAQDVVGQHYLTDTSCTNCDFNALLFNLHNPDYTKLGWLGGCGSMICIGQINFLVEDQTGQFFGQVGQAIGNNTYFGPNNTFCGRQNYWNGYWCPSINVGVLNFLSTAPDQNTRLFSPTILQGTGFYNLLNAFAEWNWNGPEPNNSRESKFVGLIQVNTTINLTNTGENPTTSDYWLSQRNASGTNYEWVIISLQFSVPNIVQVNVNGQVVQPGLTKFGKDINLLDYTSQCGYNNYFYQNRTIQFVVTAGCKVSLSLKNTLMVSTRLEITTQEFFGTKFLQYAFALLGGDPYNYFIVGTYKSNNRRFLSEYLDVQWGVVASEEIGVASETSPSATLEAMAAKLPSFNPIELGTVVSNTAELQVITTLNYPSTEATSSSSNSSSNNDDEGYYGNEPVNQQDDEIDQDPSLNDDLLQQNDYVGDSSDESEDGDTTTINKTSGLKQDKPSSGDHDLLIIVVCIVGGVVLIALIISATLWNRKQNVLKTRVHQQSHPDILSKPEQVDDDIVQYNI